MDYEFKLFAGLTMKQFIIIAVSGAIAFGIFQLRQMGIIPDVFMWVLLPTVLLGGIGLGMGSYQKRPFDEWVTHFFRAINSPLRRTWKKSPEPVLKEKFFGTKVTVFPKYMSVYFLNEDEYRKVTQYSVNQAPVAQTPVNLSPIIPITAENIADYADPNIILPMIPNTIAFRIMQDGIPIEGVIVYVKDSNGNVVTALKSNESGILYFDQSFPNGIYVFEFQSELVGLPKLQIMFEGGNYPLLNITPLA
jgi:hypothetical protein